MSSTQTPRPTSRKKIIRNLLVAGSVAISFILVKFIVPLGVKYLNLNPNDTGTYTSTAILMLLIVLLHWYWILFENTKEESLEIIKEYFLEMQHLMENNLGSARDETKNILEKLVITARLIHIPKADRYTTLFRFADAFESKAWVCWFNSRPPKENTAKDRERYLERMDARARENSDTEVKRIILGTRENLPWILKLIEDYKGSNHVSFGIIFQEERPLSVQIFDATRAMIINPKDTGTIHDVVIEDPLGAELMQLYYQTLWEKSCIIFNRGECDEDCLEKVKSLILNGSAGNGNGNGNGNSKKAKKPSPAQPKS